MVENFSVCSGCYSIPYIPSWNDSVDHIRGVEVKELAVILSVFAFGLLSGIGLLSIYDETRQMKVTCYEIRQEQEKTSGELNQLKKELAVNTEVCNQIINGKW